MADAFLLWRQRGRNAFLWGQGVIDVPFCRDEQGQGAVDVPFCRDEQGQAVVDVSFCSDEQGQDACRAMKKPGCIPEKPVPIRACAAVVSQKRLISLTSARWSHVWPVVGPVWPGFLRRSHFCTHPRMVPLGGSSGAAWQFQRLLLFQRPPGPPVRAHVRKYAFCVGLVGHFDGFQARRAFGHPDARGDHAVRRQAGAFQLGTTLGLGNIGLQRHDQAAGQAIAAAGRITQYR